MSTGATMRAGGSAASDAKARGLEAGAARLGRGAASPSDCSARARPMGETRRRSRPTRETAQQRR